MACTAHHAAYDAHRLRIEADDGPGRGRAPAGALERPDGLGVFIGAVTEAQLIDEGGRRFTRWNCAMDISVQDRGRTLKIFIGEPKPADAVDPQVTSTGTPSTREVNS
jgi:hypothetical protein